MYERRDTSAYLRGVDEFIDCAKEHMRRTGDVAILCPCVDCRNNIKSGDLVKVKRHLVCRGFKEGYTRWVWHGERPEGSGCAGSSRATNVPENIPRIL